MRSSSYAGMAEPVHEAFRRLGFRLRVYSPMGELVPGMAYLVRRLLENTSNDSFVRLRFAEHKDLASLVAARWPTSTPSLRAFWRLQPSLDRRPRRASRAPMTPTARAMVRARGAAPDERRPRVGTGVPRRRGQRPGRCSELRTNRTIVSVDPADPRRSSPCRLVVARRKATGPSRLASRPSKPGAVARQPTVPACCSGRQTGCAGASSRSPPSRSSKPEVLGRRGRGRGGGDRLSRVLRPAGLAPGARRRGPVATGRGQPLTYHGRVSQW